MIIQKNRCQSLGTENPQDDTTTDEDKNDFDKFFEESFLSESSPNVLSDQFLLEKIIKISLQPRQIFIIDPFEYYEQFRNKDPLLFELATTVLAAPATQVSVERAFSALKILITPQRTNLKKKTIEDVLLVSLNREMISCVNFENM